MKATIWIELRVEVEVEGSTELECRQNAVRMIDDLQPDDMTLALSRAKSVGAAYPHDVTEIVEVSD